MGIIPEEVKEKYEERITNEEVVEEIPKKSYHFENDTDDLFWGNCSLIGFQQSKH